MSTIWGDLVWRDGGWLGGCHEHELLVLSGLGEPLEPPASRTCLTEGSGTGHDPWELERAGGDRRTNDRLSAGQRAFNRCQAGLRVLVEQAIGRLANAWAFAPLARATGRL